MGLTGCARLTVMKQVGSEEARRSFRDLLDEVQGGASAEIMRYDKAVAVLVPAGWYDAVLGYLSATAFTDEMPDEWRVLSDTLHEGRRRGGAAMREAGEQAAAKERDAQ